MISVEKNKGLMDRVDHPTTQKVCIAVPRNLMRVLQAEAMLNGTTLEDNIIDRLHETIISWLDSDFPGETFKQAYTDQRHDEGAVKKLGEVS